MEQEMARLPSLAKVTSLASRGTWSSDRTALRQVYCGSSRRPQAVFKSSDTFRKIDRSNGRANRFISGDRKRSTSITIASKRVAKADPGNLSRQLAVLEATMFASAATVLRCRDHSPDLSVPRDL